MKGKFGSATKL
uniref:Uncharacterized protein n=1 Tax=Rhizophora mucronata TaxID=61149 RepID=A0A2P2PU92_RHIMU